MKVFTARVLTVPLLIAGCSDFSLFGKSDPPDGGGDAAADSGGECRGLDVAEAAAVTGDPTCTASGDGGGSGDPWLAAVQWQITSLPVDSDATQSAVTPILAQLDDDEALEVVTVVAHRFGNDDVGWVAVFDGAAGAFEWAWYGAFPTGALLAADVNDDGANEVLAENASGALVALRGDGTELWTSSAVAPVDSGYSIPINVGDLDDDGSSEVLYGRWILNGVTGAVEGEGSAELDDDGVYLHAAAIADLDLDGSPEIVLDGIVFDGSFNPVQPLLETGDARIWPVVVQADGDDQGEVGFLRGDGWLLADSDGTVLADVQFSPAVEPGAPCVADFDGDGDAEVAWPDNDTLTMMELDGTVEWTAQTSDTTSAAGCVGFDFDADGAVDVVYGDEVSLAIYSGRNGERMWEPSAPHRSWTHVETPAIGDVDADGHADLVFVDNDGYEARPDGWGTPPFLTVVAASPGAWPPAGTWPLTEYMITNVLPDGTVPADPVPSWLANNTYRALPATVAPGQVDLSIAIIDVCEEDCEAGRLLVSYQVSNLGAIDASAGAAVTLSVDGASEGVTVILPEIPAGRRLPGGTAELAFDPESSAVVRAVVVRDGVDCNSENDKVVDGAWCVD